jgi:DNA-binding transcriptional ArsR family regulator
MKSAIAVECLGALAQENRLDIFRLLVQAGPRGLPAGQLAAKLDLAGPTLSFHLNHLYHAGLVFRRRDGRSIIYAANFPAMSRLVAYLTENCCRGEGCAIGTPPTQAKGASHAAPARARRGQRP